MTNESMQEAISSLTSQVEAMYEEKERLAASAPNGDVAAYVRELEIARESMGEQLAALYAESNR